MLFSEKNSLLAWQAAAQHLIKHGDAYNLTVEINNPLDFEQSWLTDFNPKHLKSKKGDDIRNVIHTIFPVKYLDRYRDRDEIYARYLQTHYRSARLGSRKKDRWGTYFIRLICFEQSGRIRDAIKGKTTLAEITKVRKEVFGDNNQLERVIHALGTWRNSPKAAIYCHLSGASLDSLQPLGSPCLQYIQFSQPKPGQVDMTVIYRSHDYFNKALGNFIGLGQLLKFVCDQSGKNPGKLTCHAIRAYFDASQASMKELLKA